MKGNRCKSNSKMNLTIYLHRYKNSTEIKAKKETFVNLELLNNNAVI